MSHIGIDAPMTASKEMEGNNHYKGLDTVPWKTDLKAEEQRVAECPVIEEEHYDDHDDIDDSEGSNCEANVQTAAIASVLDMARYYIDQGSFGANTTAVIAAVDRVEKQLEKLQRHADDAPQSERQRNASLLSWQTIKDQLHEELRMLERAGVINFSVEELLGWVEAVASKDQDTNSVKDQEESDSNQEEHDAVPEEDELEATTVISDMDEAVHHEESKTLDDHLSAFASPAHTTVKPCPLLSLTVAEPKRKGVQEPRPPRRSDGPKVAQNQPAQAKFQFADDDVAKQMLEADDEDSNAMAAIARELASKSSAVSCQYPLRSMSLAKRRYSSAGIISNGMSLRRKSFTMKKNCTKTNTTELPPADAMARLASRRKSASIYPPGRRLSSIPTRTNGTTMLRRPSFKAYTTTSSSSSTVSLASQLVVRVRERSDRKVPEVVISKKPRMGLVWHWNDHRIRVPFTIQLGPHQHGIMLRQLRYVKSMMHDLPWAKTHLRELLAAYTKKDMSKEDLYPQLNHLSHQVQQEVEQRSKKQQQVLARRQELTIRINNASNVLNELRVTKYGRRGKPHATRLLYDMSEPTKLYWQRKTGERSDECIDLATVQILEGGEQLATSVFRKAARKYALPSDCCVSLVTPERTLDLQMRNAIDRDWLVKALNDVVDFAQQYKAMARKPPGGPRVLRRM